MRLSEDQIKQGILHSDIKVREAAVRYFTRSYSQDQTVLPLIFQAIEEYGWDDAFTYYSFLDHLPQTSETVIWLIQEVKRIEEIESLEEYLENLDSLLASADVEILSQQLAEVLAATAEAPNIQERIQRRIELSKSDVETCWRELNEFCEKNKSLEYVNQADATYFNNLIEAMARLETDENRILSLLAEEIDDYEDNPKLWMEIFMVALAGKMRLESAIPFILGKLLFDGSNDWLASECEEALIQIGSDAVVQAIAEHYVSADFYPRMTLANVLEHIHSEFSLKTLLDLLAIEEEDEVRTVLGQAMLAQFDSEGIEPVYEMIQDGSSDPEISDLRTDLLAVTTLLEIEIPERDEWKQELEAKELRIQQMLNGELEFDPLEVFGPNPFGDEENYLDDEEDWPEGEGPEFQVLEGEATPACYVTKGSTVGRNEPCPCGSGKKYKKCCLHKQDKQEIDTF